ncbi:hypothetical protein [Flavobacterium hungaricum]|uniref:Uncharacterized protein n=1 Tax=Flavobacterium hungaricum TaxID=2082725 RepID=A0ABR9TL82_9FLAO|nr:hypothetical protein [Flavobacterium hungaricum]MBE8725772.1 hypothetical protein [Flavobacterium hungaricum]
MQKPPRTWQERRKSYLAVSIICFIAGICFFYNVTAESYIIKTAELNTIDKLVISEKPVFKKTNGKHSRRWIEFKCAQNYSTFEITSFDYSCALRSEIYDEINPGDTISIQVLHKEMENFDTENVCKIHSLVKNDKEYLDMECRNNADNYDGKRGCIILLAISLMTFIVYALEKKPILFDQMDPAFIIGMITLILFFALRSIG